MNLDTEIDGLRLSPLGPSSLEDYYSLVDANRAHLTRYGDYAELGAATLDSVREDLAADADDALRFEVRLDEVLIGRVDLAPREPGNYVLGYWLDEAHSGHGYATTACRASIEFARHRGATTIWAGVTIGNVRSENVLNRLGFEAVKEMGSYVRYRLMLTPESIFHITSQGEWEAAREAGEYRRSTRGLTLEEQGFIHCSGAEQVERIANALYADSDEWLVVLEVAPERLDAEVRYENLEGGAELFPHIYGPLPIPAVTSVWSLLKDSDGRFVFAPGTGEVSNPFVGRSVAARYAHARPYLHDAAIQALFPSVSRVQRAIDVGCGTGLSTKALLTVSDVTVGIDASTEMLLQAQGRSESTFVAGVAEELPFRDGSFDLVTVASAIHWFAPEAVVELRRVLRQEGVLLVYDVWFRAEIESAPGFGSWLSALSADRYRPVARYPMPDLERHGFRHGWSKDIRREVRMSLDELVAYLMTHSERIAAVQSGIESEEEQRDALACGAAPFYAGAVDRELAFGIRAELFMRS